jgi:superfamily I DNA/RNA helicase
METNQPIRRYIEAPAGHGKTEEIANMVAKFSGGCVLILTHTNAGVSSLRKRLKRKNVQSSSFELLTIDSFCLKFSQYYPSISGIPKKIEEINGDTYKNARKGAIKIFDFPELKDFLKLKYSFMIVDEYQDCSTSQHELVMKLSEVINCVVFGDPMQSIFDFDSEGFSWENNLCSDFIQSEKIQLDTPYRWVKFNCEDLGSWMNETRIKLKEGKREEINFNNLPGYIRSSTITITPEHESQIIANEICKEIPESGSVLAIVNGNGPEKRHFYHKIAGKMYISLQSIERIDSKELFTFLKKLDSFLIQPNLKPIAFHFLVREFAKKCMIDTTALPISIKDKLKEFKRKSILEMRDLAGRLRGDNLIIYNTILDVFEYTDSKSILRNILKLMKFFEAKSSKIYRKELWYSAIESLQKFLTTDVCELRECGQMVRQKTSFLGRNFNRVIGTTLLTKGLEFDHVIIVDPDSLSDKNLYVALSRARKGISIIHIR